MGGCCSFQSNAVMPLPVGFNGRSPSPRRKRMLDFTDLSGDDDEELPRFRQECLVAHNMYRRRHGAPGLVLSGKLNRVAQSWASHLTASKSMDNNVVPYGENIAWGPGDLTTHGWITVHQWYRDIDKYNFETGGFTAGHFTQLVWKQSAELGVGRSVSRDGQVGVVVCNYHPAATVDGDYSSNVLPTRSYHSTTKTVKQAWQ